MTPQEFKAWFDGFTEAMEGTPTKKQWERIRKRVAEIDGTPITYPVYVRDYWPRYIPYNPPLYPTWTYLSSNTAAQGQLAQYTQSATSLFNSTNAMYVCGQSDAEEVAN